MTFDAEHQSAASCAGFGGCLCVHRDGCYCRALSHEDGGAQGGGLLSVDGNNNGETNEVTEPGGQKGGNQERYGT